MESKSALTSFEALNGSPQEPKEKRSAFLLGDVDAIKDYVYEGQKLPEIRGASQILVELESQTKEIFKKRGLSDGLIYCGGGSFLALVPADIAHILKEEIEQLYLRATTVATITIVAMEVKDDCLENGVPFAPGIELSELGGEGVAGDLVFSHFDAIVADRKERKNFGEHVAFLSAKLRIAKQGKSSVPFLPSLPVHQRCQSCGKRPANRLDTAVTPAEWLCEVCYLKREKGRVERGRFIREFISWYKDKYQHDLFSKLAPKDLGELAGQEGRIAFLYADGNNIGDLLQRARTLEDYRSISEALSEIVRAALFEALVQTIGRDKLEEREVLPFEIIAIGGDDVTIILPAQYGWQLSLKLLQKFEEKIKEKGVTPQPTMSAGLVIADVKYPIHFMQRLAESLLKKAKMRAKETGKSALCHLWLRDPVASEDAEAILKSLYYREDRQGKRWLTIRPYTLEEARKLTLQAERLKSLTAAQRRVLAESLELGVHASLNTALYQIAKEEKAEYVRVFKELGDLVYGTGLCNRFFFWQRRESIWHTPLLDALELVELWE